MWKLRLAVLLAMILTLGVSAVQQSQPAEKKTYVHVWVLRVVVVDGVNTPNYVMTHLTEGPFEHERAVVRRREIATVGLETGAHFYPVHRVQLVELR